LPGSKGREADQLPPSNAEVKIGGATPPLPNMSSYHRAELMKHKDNFALYMYHLYTTVKISDNRKDEASTKTVVPPTNSMELSPS
jgi:hypothetical protein